MGKILCIFFLLCTVVGSGTLWFKKHRPRAQIFKNIEIFVTQLLDEASETLFLREPPPPDPEAVTRFKDAVDRELQRLHANRQQAVGGSMSGPKLEQLEDAGELSQ